MMKNVAFTFNLVFKRTLKLHSSVQDRNIFRSFHLGISSNASKNVPDQKPEVRPFKEDHEDVWIGPPNPVSNLRLKVFPQSANLSDEEKYYYSKCKETQDWNQQYWAAHNKDFKESRKLYVDKVSKEQNLPKDKSLTSEEISIFYKNFLDRNRSKHIAYNLNWYRRNFNLLFLAAKVNLNKFRKTIRNSVKLKS